MKPLDLESARAIVPRLCATHSEEILRDFCSLDEWALDRATRFGCNYVLSNETGPMVIGGVIDHGEDGCVWFAGADGWQRYLKTMLRIFREVQRSRAYRALECECCADNAKARHLIERAGFNPCESNKYRMVL